MVNNNNIRIHIIFSKKCISKDSGAFEAGELALLNRDTNINLERLWGVFYTVDGSIKKAFICTSNVGDIEYENECYVQTLCPPDRLESWEIPMSAERILQSLRRHISMVEVPAWSIKTFGMEC